jgi:Domain of unknown function (DUF4283)
VDLPVQRWDPTIDEGLRLCPVWVLVWGFPMKLWYFYEFAHLFEPYGQVLALDSVTADHIDFRVARVCVGLCDNRDLPALLWMLYCDQSGFWSHFDVSLEIEQPPPPPVTQSSSRGLGGGGGGSNDLGSDTSGYFSGPTGPHSSSGKGRWNDPGAGSSLGSSPQPPPLKKRLLAGKSTGNIGDEGQDEFDIMNNGDLVQTKFTMLVDLPEESPFPQPTNSPVVIGHAHTQSTPLVITAVELVNPVEVGVPLVMSPNIEG